MQSAYLVIPPSPVAPYLPAPASPLGRFASSPSGALHFGSWSPPWAALHRSRRTLAAAHRTMDTYARCQRRREHPSPRWELRLRMGRRSLRQSERGKPCSRLERCARPTSPAVRVFSGAKPPTARSRAWLAPLSSTTATALPPGRTDAGRCARRRRGALCDAVQGERSASPPMPATAWSSLSAASSPYRLAVVVDDARGGRDPRRARRRCCSAHRAPDPPARPTRPPGACHLIGYGSISVRIDQIRSSSDQINLSFFAGTGIFSNH